MIPPTAKTATNDTAAALEAGAALADQPRPFEIAETPAILLPTGLTLVDLEKYLPKPKKLKQTVKMITPAALSTYVSLFGQPGRTIIFADQIAASLTAALDYHGDPDDPSWNHHRAICTLTETDEWMAWSALDGEEQAQFAFAQFLEDRIPDILHPNAADIIEAARNFEARKDVTFQSSKRMSDGSIQFTYNEEVQGASKVGAMKVPTDMTLVIAPFEGAPKRQVEARIRYRIDSGGKLAIWFDLIQAKEHRDESFTEVLLKVASDTKDHVKAVVLGSIG